MPPTDPGAHDRATGLPSVPQTGTGDRGGPPTTLARSLTTTDAVMVGLGAMLGAGVFAAVGPAAAAAGPWLLLGLALAAIVAYCNATSSAQLAALHPESGGTYVYARHRLGAYPGFLAGWSFVVGKSASLAAMALTFGSYVAADLARPLAVLAVVVLTAVNVAGVQRTARLTRVLVTVVLLTLVVVVVAALSTAAGGAGVVADSAPTVVGVGPLDVLRAAGLLFFAFAGYARIATLGEEVVDPATTIPRAIPRALGIVVATYVLVMGTALLAVGADVLASAPAPLAAVVAAGPLAGVAPLVRVGAAVAAAGVLLSLLAGVSRTGLAMARRRELPGQLDAVHPRFRTPYRAELLVGALVCAVVLVADLRGAIGFSSLGVLTYYALANASAWTLSPEERRWPRWLSGLGIVGCVVLALSLPGVAVLGGVALLAVGSLVWWLTSPASPRAIGQQR